MSLLKASSAVMLLSLPLNAGLLYMTNISGADFSNLPPSNVNYTTSVVLTPGQTLPVGSAGSLGAASYSAYLSFGRLGLDISSSNSCAISICGGAHTPEGLGAYSSDYAVIEGVWSGTLRLQYSFEGP